MKFKELKQLIDYGEYRITELMCKNDKLIENVANAKLEISDDDKTFDDYSVRYIDGGLDENNDCCINVYVIKERMTRIDWLMQDKEKLLTFIDMVSRGDQDCSYCPFCEDGIILGCCYCGAEEWEVGDCRLSDTDIDDFLKEEMPTEEMIERWKNESVGM